MLCPKHQKLTFEKKKINRSVCFQKNDPVTQDNPWVLLSTVFIGTISLAQNRFSKNSWPPSREMFFFFCDYGELTHSDSTVSGSLLQCIPLWRGLQWGRPLFQSSRSMVVGLESAHTGCLLQREKLVGWGIGWSRLPCCWFRISITFNDKNYIVVRHYKTVSQNRGKVLHQAQSVRQKQQALTVDR